MIDLEDDEWEGRGLNVVRSGRPEQCAGPRIGPGARAGSQCSPVWKTGTIVEWVLRLSTGMSSQCSPVWKTGTIILSYGEM